MYKHTSSGTCSWWCPLAPCMLMMCCCFSVDLLGLLNWRSNPEDLDQILQRLMEVEGSEIVKVSNVLNVKPTMNS